MSREIKFRVWDKSSKRMYGWESVKRDADFDDIVDSYGNWMQYTGLHDKNGKEIYEGDIVRQRRLSCKEGKIVDYLVGFNHYMFTAKDKEHEISLCSIVPCAELEVIGNVHENHELLEG